MIFIKAISIVLVIAVVFFSLSSICHQNEHEKRLEDEEQMDWLLEYRKRKEE